jgi:hypothetical protein
MAGCVYVATNSVNGKQSVFRVCNGKYPSVKGLKFSYVR